MLPGLRFDPQARVVAAALPRMDVAAFVGLAARGPLHLPVPLEDEAAFVRIFGELLLLARERGSGQPIHGHLATAVRAFFANGGRRCWVVRVAGASARSNRFRLPGLRHAVHAATGWQVDAAVFAAARCEGHWSDGLQVRTALRTRPATLIDAGRRAQDAAIEMRLRASPPPASGELLCVDAGDGTPQAWLPVTSVTSSDDGTFILASAPGLQLSSGGLPLGDVDAAGLAAQGRARFVSLDLEVTDNTDGSVRRIEDLGLVRGHARDWRLLRSDARTFAPDARPSPLDTLDCPIAAGDAGADGFDLPWAPELGTAGPESADDGSMLERDGLSTFDASLFVDADLADTERSGLLERADELRYTGAAPRALQGLHALLGYIGSTVQDEVTLIAAPDAVLRPWQRIADDAPDPVFSELPTPGAASPEAGGAEPPPTFADCQSNAPPSPGWRRDDCRLAADALVVSWQPGPDRPNLTYRLQAGTTGDLADPDTVQVLDLPTATLLGSPIGERFLRVRTEVDGAVGDWSTVLRVSARGLPQVVVDPEAGSPALYPVQCAMLRLAAARGDMFALLGLPFGWREDAALQHAGRLMALNADGCTPSTGGYGALYHPWLLAADGAQGLVAVPPDGLAAGVLARRAAERGAWVAPANEALRGLVALTPPLQPARWQALEDGHVNVLRREPAAFVVLSETTLASEVELVPIHVRRLLSLLRRLALRLGDAFVFEPNSRALRMSMQAHCEQALERLYQRGAFAGARAADGFQASVRADASGAGVVVELRVRPAPALRFITIRLAQAGASASVAEVL